jgi:diguanylate cyclase (GGDEF)-like protein
MGAGFMRNEVDYSFILRGYRRFAIAIATLVGLMLTIRTARYLGFVPAPLDNLAPVVGVLIGAMLVAILFYGHQWLSRALSTLSRAARLSRERAYRDALTGVFTRAYFLEALSADVFHGSEQAVGYLQIDMDNLKLLNDSAGHAAGDAALVQLSRVIAAVVPGAVVGRLGGDEFGVMVKGHDNKQGLRRLGQELLRQLERPTMIAGRPVRLSASIGVSLAPHDATDAVDLISKADLALYRGKRSGRRSVVAFEPDMLGDERQRRFIERELRAAMMMDELKLHYQPIFGPDLRIRSYEALVRWRHPVRGMISPSQFIPVAEESDLIDKLGEWVLRRACADLEALDGRPVAINVSPAQLRHPDFGSRFLAILAEASTPAARLIVEITETVPLSAGQAELDNLHQLRAAGVRIAIDDFGAGHASLQYLRGFAFDIIKIDRSYVANLGINRIDAMIVSAICDIARSLPVEVVAEGVETEAQLALLRQAGCTGFQGFLLGRPAPLARRVAVAA